MIMTSLILFMTLMIMISAVYVNWYKLYCFIFSTVWFYFKTFNTDTILFIRKSYFCIFEKLWKKQPFTTFNCYIWHVWPEKYWYRYGIIIVLKPLQVFKTVHSLCWYQSQMYYISECMVTWLLNLHQSFGTT